MLEPFDARRAMLVDQRQPHGEWRIVSLVTALLIALRPTPETPVAGDQEPRVDAVRQIIRELECRGVDGESLVRLGFAPEIVWCVIAIFLPDLFAGRAGDDRDLSGSSVEFMTDAGGRSGVAAWTAAIPMLAPAPVLGDEEEPGEVVRRLGNFVRGLTARLLPWIFTAPLEDLISHRAPRADAIPADVPFAPEPELLEQYRWMVDRFSTTHLFDWSTPSLHCEYRWLMNEQCPPCGEDLMSDRAVDIDELAREIARRATAPRNSLVGLEHDAMILSLTSKVHTQAIALLRQARYKEAATLFELVLSENPHDSQAENNLGFCLLPVDPAAALAHLDRAASLNYDHPVINLCNRLLCRLLLGHASEVLRLAEENWETAVSVRAGSGALWIPADSGMQLLECEDVLRVIALVCHRAAISLGDLEAARRWKAREEERSSVG